MAIQPIGFSAKFEGRPGTEFSNESLVVYFPSVAGVEGEGYKRNVVRPAAESLGMNVTFGSAIVLAGIMAGLPNLEGLVEELGKQFQAQRAHMAAARER